jgi:hypothetical protein
VVELDDDVDEVAVDDVDVDEVEESDFFVPESLEDVDALESPDLRESVR